MGGALYPSSVSVAGLVPALVIGWRLSGFGYFGLEVGMFVPHLPPAALHPCVGSYWVGYAVMRGDQVGWRCYVGQHWPFFGYAQHSTVLCTAIHYVGGRVGLENGGVAEDLGDWEGHRHESHALCASCNPHAAFLLIKMYGNACNLR